MTRLLALALIAAVLTGCNKKTDKNEFAPADKGGPAGPAAPPPESKNTNYVPGGGVIKNAANATRRTVELVYLKDLGVTITAMELENGKMPSKDEIIAEVRKEPAYKKLMELIDEGTIKLTGTKNRSAMWAYEVDSETRGGLALVAGTASRKSAEEIKTLLQGV
jgi:hypothetical protein